MQQVQDATVPFVHLPGCKVVRVDQHPWYELANLLTHLPTSNLRKDLQ
jgi:hypothetical protein